MNTLVTILKGEASNELLPVDGYHTILEISGENVSYMQTADISFRGNVKLLGDGYLIKNNVNVGKTSYFDSAYDSTYGFHINSGTVKVVGKDADMMSVIKVNISNAIVDINDYHYIKNSVFSALQLYSKIIGDIEILTKVPFGFSSFILGNEDGIGIQGNINNIGRSQSAHPVTIAIANHRYLEGNLEHFLDMVAQSCTDSGNCTVSCMKCPNIIYNGQNMTIGKSFIVYFDSNSHTWSEV